MGPRQNENAHASAAEDEIFYWARRAITERAKRSDEGPHAGESDNKGTRAARAIKLCSCQLWWARKISLFYAAKGSHYALHVMNVNQRSALEHFSFRKKLWNHLSFKISLDINILNKYMTHNRHPHNPNLVIGCDNNNNQCLNLKYYYEKRTTLLNKLIVFNRVSNKQYYLTLNKNLLLFSCSLLRHFMAPCTEDWGHFYQETKPSNLEQTSFELLAYQWHKANAEGIFLFFFCLVVTSKYAICFLVSASLK